MTIQSGDIIKITHVEEEVSDELCRTASTYGHGFELELVPRTDTEYIVCQGDDVHGYTVRDRKDKSKPIGYVINSNKYRISQVGFEWRPIEITKVGVYEGEVPDTTPIGSQVFIVSV